MKDLDGLVAAVRHARANGLKVSMMGAGHSADGQQFCDGALLLDVRGLSRVLSVDEEAGVAVLEAGVTWEDFVLELARRKSVWGIHLKQTLLNKATVGGSVAVNIHARKINSQPMIRYIRSLTLVDAPGEVRTLSRTQNAELFSLVVGGYGAFGVVYSVELELQRTRNLVRDPILQIPLDEVAERYLEKMAAGYLYGDAHSNGAGIAQNWAYLTMYQATDELPQVLPFKNTRVARSLYSFGVYLAHVAPSLPLLIWKSEMEKAGRYTNTDSCQFTSLGEYYEHTHDGTLGFEGNDFHIELQIDPGAVRSFVKDMRDAVGRLSRHCIFCDLRFVRKDTESFLAYAQEDRFTLSPTFHVDRSNEKELLPLYQRLYDLAVDKYGGKFYLWDYFLGRPEHFRKAYPHLREFLAKKQQYDPDGLFHSLWLEKVRGLFEVSDAQPKRALSL